MVSDFPTVDWARPHYLTETAVQEFIAAQRDLPPEFARVVDEHFWDLLV